jgi:hypothetical protein
VVFHGLNFQLPDICYVLCLLRPNYWNRESDQPENNQDHPGEYQSIQATHNNLQYMFAAAAYRAATLLRNYCFQRQSATSGVATQ